MKKRILIIVTTVIILLSVNLHLKSKMCVEKPVTPKEMIYESNTNMLPEVTVYGKMIKK